MLHWYLFTDATMIQFEDISTDVLDIAEQFVSKIVDSSPDNADTIMDVRQKAIKHIAQYLCDDSLCGYEISKRLLLQSWSDHYPEPLTEEEQTKSVWSAVMRYANTDQFSTVLRTIDVTGNGSHNFQQVGRDRQDLVRVLTAYCAYFSQHGNFDNFDSSNHGLCGGRLSKKADEANNVLLQQVAIHTLTRGKKALMSTDLTAVAVDNPLEHIVHVISKAHFCRKSLVEGLSSSFIPAVGVDVAGSPDPSMSEFDLSAPKLKKAVL